MNVVMHYHLIGIFGFPFCNCYNLTDMFSQYEMYIIERNAERTSSAGRLLYDM